MIKLLISLIASVSCGILTQKDRLYMYQQLPEMVQRQTGVDDMCIQWHDITSEMKWLVANRYEIIKEVNSGSQATVYKARDHCDHQIVAVKVFAGQDETDFSKVNEGMQEYNSLKHIENVRGCMQVRNSIQISQVYFLVLDFYDGDVADLIDDFAENGQEISLSDIKMIAREVSHCLAHLANIMHVQHNDVKPDNIMLKFIPDTYDIEKVALADFGAAARIGQMGGVFTPEYAAPERTLDSGVSYQNSDAYSLAATVFTLYNGTQLFDFREAGKLHIAKYTLDLYIQQINEPWLALLHIVNTFSSVYASLTQTVMLQLFYRYFRPWKLLVSRRTPGSEHMFYYLSQSLLWDPLKRLSVTDSLKQEFLRDETGIAK